MIKHSLVILVTGLLLGVVMPGYAGDSLLPEIPAAQDRYSTDQGCVEPTAEMRKNHMEYILHQRDETMHRGVRTRQYSLVECINCHVSDAPDAPRVSNQAHFCNSCHTYAAVSIDCFQCHADRPVKTSGMQHGMPATAQPGSSGAAVLASEESSHE
ncbi:MAG TPA: sulfur reduction protein DsrJ [Gammaproteobacteria bacterium]|nr:sulfur reduction protein DsrJ [Gammaproteobacteria bacterium]